MKGARVILCSGRWPTRRSCKMRNRLVILVALFLLGNNALADDLVVTDFFHTGSGPCGGSIFRCGKETCFFIGEHFGNSATVGRITPDGEFTPITNFSVCNSPTDVVCSGITCIVGCLSGFVCSYILNDNGNIGQCDPTVDNDCFIESCADFDPVVAMAFGNCGASGPCLGLAGPNGVHVCPAKGKGKGKQTETVDFDGCEEWLTLGPYTDLDISTNGTVAASKTDGTVDLIKRGRDGTINASNTIEINSFGGHTPIGFSRDPNVLRGIEQGFPANLIGITIHPNTLEIVGEPSNVELPLDFFLAQDIETGLTVNGHEMTFVTALDVFDLDAVLSGVIHPPNLVFDVEFFDSIEIGPPSFSTLEVEKIKNETFVLVPLFNADGVATIRVDVENEPR